MNYIPLEVVTQTDYPKSYIGYVNEITARQIGLEEGVYQIRYTKYAYPVEPYGIQEAFATTGINVGKNYYRKATGTWSGWKNYITNSDFEKNYIRFGNSYIQFGADWGWTCCINFMGQLAKNKVSGGELQPYSNIITQNDMPVFESFIVNPNSSTDITLTLSNNASSGAIFAVNGDIDAFNGSILGVQIVHGTNQLRVLLSKAHTGNIRINVMYMRTI